MIHSVRPNREYEIREPPITPRAPSPEPRPLAPWFRDVSAQLGHRHVETPFNDWARQPLLPQALSQLGPGVTWYDVAGDGNEDLLITSGRGGALAYYRNDGNHLSRVDLHVPPAPYDETTVLPLPDGRGGTMLRLGGGGGGGGGACGAGGGGPVLGATGNVAAAALVGPGTGCGLPGGPKS